MKAWKESKKVREGKKVGRKVGRKEGKVKARIIPPLSFPRLSHFIFSSPFLRRKIYKFPGT